MKLCLNQKKDWYSMNYFYYKWSFYWEKGRKVKILIVDFNYFIDAANVWGVDYSNAVGDSSHIRSSTGIGLEWFSPIGPFTFTLAQPISKIDTDTTQTFQFNIGTTF